MQNGLWLKNFVDVLRRLMFIMSLNQLASVLRRYLSTRATLAANLLVKKIGRLSLEEGRKNKNKQKQK
jgi:hypothetical protein